MLNYSLFECRDNDPVFIDGKPVIIVSFSGGQTSAFMCKKLKEEIGHIYHIIFVFANTGCENNETLDFVHECDQHFGLNVVWLEAVVNPVHRKGITHRVTNYHDAYRVTQYKDPKHPFHAHIRKSGIPNPNKPQCSDRLKAFAIEHYKKVHGLKGQPHAIGIRDDESSRILKPALSNLIKNCGYIPKEWRLIKTHKERLKILDNAVLLTEKQKNQITLYSYNLAKLALIYPLTDIWPTSKGEINDTWEDMPFRLQLEEHEGNCQTCWKKSENKLFLLAHENPERFEAFDWWEKTYHHIKPNDNGTKRVFFRKNRSAEDIQNGAKLFTPEQLRRIIYGAGEKADDESGCSESCESYSLFQTKKRTLKSALFLCFVDQL